MLTRVSYLKSPLEFVQLTRVNEYYRYRDSRFSLPSFFVSWPLIARSLSSSPITEPYESQLYLRLSINVEGGIFGFSSCAGGSGRDGRLPCLARLRNTSPSQAHCNISQR